MLVEVWLHHAAVRRGEREVVAFRRRLAALVARVGVEPWAHGVEVAAEPREGVRLGGGEVLGLRGVGKHVVQAAYRAAVEACSETVVVGWLVLAHLAFALHAAQELEQLRRRLTHLEQTLRRQRQQPRAAQVPVGLLCLLRREHLRPRWPHRSAVSGRRRGGVGRRRLDASDEAQRRVPIGHVHHGL